MVPGLSRRPKGDPLDSPVQKKIINSQFIREDKYASFGIFE